MRNIEGAKKEILAAAKKILPSGAFFMPDTYEWLELKLSAIDNNYSDEECEELINEWQEYIKEKTPAETEPEKSVMKINDYFGGETEVTLEKGTYYNGNLRIQLWCEDGPYATLTTNFEKKLPEGYAYVGVNNVPGAEAFIKKYGLGEPQGKFKMSGFCCYPLYKFF